MSSISYFRLPPSISMFFFYIYLQFLVFSQMGTCTSTRLLIIPINKIPRTWKYQIYIRYVHIYCTYCTVYTLPSNLIDTYPTTTEWTHYEFYYYLCNIWNTNYSPAWTNLSSYTRCRFRPRKFSLQRKKVGHWASPIILKIISILRINIRYLYSNKKIIKVPKADG